MLGYENQEAFKSVFHSVVFCSGVVLWLFFNEDVCCNTCNTGVTMNLNDNELIEEKKVSRGSATVVAYIVASVIFTFGFVVGYISNLIRK